MQSTWASFENWLKKNYKQGYADLNPPASDEDIAHLEEALNIKLPIDFVQCLKNHNGQAGDAGGLFDGSEFLSTDRILDEFSVWQDLLDDGSFDGIESEPAQEIKKDWWNKRWIPFTYDGSGNHYCVDLDPTQLGQSGQVMTMWHDDPDRRCLASSFDAWFKAYVAALLNGEYVYSEDYDAIVPIDDL